MTTWLAKYSAKTVVAAMMRISWNTVGPIVQRVSKEIEAGQENRLDGLVKIGVDETSYKKGHKYMTVITNLDSGKMVWVNEGYGKETLEKFFKSLKAEQRGSIRHIAADGARWIADTAIKWCPNAERSIDPFHVVEWATETLDNVRKRVYQETAEKIKAQKAKTQTKEAKDKVKDKVKNPVNNAKYSLLKNPDKLTAGQQAKLELLAKSTPTLYRAYLMKEKLRLVFQHPFEEAESELKSWLSWAQRCRIPEIVELRKKIKRHIDAILSSVKHGLSNALTESLNNKVKLTIRMAYGFRNIDNMLALIKLRCFGIPVSLPGRL
jgi:transposase